MAVVKSEVKSEVVTYYGRCRCCLSYGYLKDMWSEHVWKDTTEVYGEMLVECFCIALEQANGHCKDQVCEQCVLKIRSAAHFKNMVITSQEHMLNNDNSPRLNYTNMQLKYEFLDDNESETNDMEQIDIVFSNADKEDEEREYQEVEYLDEEYLMEAQRVYETVENGKSAPEPSKETKKQSRRVNKWNRKLPKSERYKTYKQYPMEDFYKAFEAVKNGEMSRSEAAKTYNVPQKTLAARMRAWEVENTPEVQCEKQNNNGATGGKAQTATTLNNLEIVKHKNNIRCILECSNATPIKGHWGVGYACCFCEQQFVDPIDLKNHTITTHTDIYDSLRVKYVYEYIVKLDVSFLQCELCNADMDSLEIFMSHLKTVHNKPIHTDIPNHIVPFKFETNVLKCVKCTKQFNTFKGLAEHMYDEHCRNYECNKCNRGFVNRRTLKTHSFRHQTGEFACTECSKVFDKRISMMDHRRIVHALASKTRKCRYCDERFMDKNRRTNHEVKCHGEIPPVYFCSACTKTFDSQRALSSHINRTHLLMRPHKCSECEMAFYHKNELKRHSVKHTGLRQFLCKICYKWYSTAKSLKEHTYIHTKERKFDCDVCEKSYAQKHTWLLHMRLKHGKQLKDKTS